MIKETKKVVYRTEVVTHDSIKCSLVFEYQDDQVTSIQFINGEHNDVTKSNKSFVIDGSWSNELLVDKFLFLMRLYFEEKSCKENKEL